MFRTSAVGFLFDVALLALLGVLVAPSQSPAASPIFIRDFAPTNVGLAIARANLRNVSLLPPVTNLAISYEFDPELSTYVSQRGDLGSGMVATPRFHGKGRFSVIMSFAYFELDEFDGDNSEAIVVNVPTCDPANPTVDLGLATRVNSEVAVTRFTGRYTILDRLDVGITIPIMSVDVDSRYLVQVLNGPAEFSEFLDKGTKSPDRGNTLFDVPLNRIDLPNGFNEGGNFHLGNIVLDSKIGVESGIEGLELGIQGAVRVPSASEDRFTGSDTTSLKGLALVGYRIHRLGFYFNGGYEHDFSEDALSNGALGASITYGIPSALVEFGSRANLYVTNIDVFESSRFAKVRPGSYVVAGDSRLGKNEASVGGGVRFNPIADLTVSAYVSFPVTDDGYQAAQIYSLSLDYPL